MDCVNIMLMTDTVERKVFINSMLNMSIIAENEQMLEDIIIKFCVRVKIG